MNIFTKNIKKNKKRIYDFLWTDKKIIHKRHLAQLSIWKGGLDILDIDTEINFLKAKCTQKLNSTNAFWKDLILYRSNLILNSNQGLVLFRQTQILRSTRHKNLRKHNNEDFIYSCLMLGFVSPITNFLRPRIWKRFLNCPSY